MTRREPETWIGRVANELYLGAGYQLRPASGVSVAPLLYFVGGKENAERGACLAASLSVDRAGWKVLGFGGHFFRASGGVSDYTFVDALDLTRTAAGQLQDHRTGQNPQHTATALLRQWIYSRLVGYEDLNDAERRRFDPTMRTVVSMPCASAWNIVD